MEVHQHAHSHGKKTWRSYGWEFLMLFLAVFCGFLAEYQLEHVVERQREKQYVRSLLEDLKNDQVIINSHISEVNNGILMMDTLIAILNDPASISNRTGDLYYLARLAPRLKPLSLNNRTFEQLKNSGNFRLIDNLKVSNKIMDYYAKYPVIHLLESINETEFTEYKKIAAKIFDPAIFLEMEGSGSQVNRGIENPLLRSTDNELLQEFSVFAVYMHGSKKGVMGYAKEIKEAGVELMKFLQDEYHIN